MFCKGDRALHLGSRTSYDFADSENIYFYRVLMKDTKDMVFAATRIPPKNRTFGYLKCKYYNYSMKLKGTRLVSNAIQLSCFIFKSFLSLPESLSSLFLLLRSLFLAFSVL